MNNLYIIIFTALFFTCCSQSNTTALKSASQQSANYIFISKILCLSSKIEKNDTITFTVNTTSSLNREIITVVFTKVNKITYVEYFTNKVLKNKKITSNKIQYNFLMDDSLNFEYLFKRLIIHQSNLDKTNTRNTILMSIKSNNGEFINFLFNCNKSDTDEYLFFFNNIMHRIYPNNYPFSTILEVEGS